MKKLLYSILLIYFMLFPACVFAKGYISVSPSSLTIEQGSSKTFVITAYNAIGDVSIKSNDSSVSSVSISEWGTGMVEEEQTKTATITVTGKSVGLTTITLTIDAATFDGDDLSGQIKTITVKVVEKNTQKPVPSPSNPSQSEPSKNLSKNNNLKSISVDGYQLEKINNNNYTLTVLNGVTNINVNATAEHLKAKISGIGKKQLQIGENIIEVIITAEDGTKNKINLKVIRKDGYYLEDLDSILKDAKIQNIDIIINNDSKISDEDISKIKESKKTLRLNYYDKNKKLIYSWAIDGEKIKDSKGFSTSIEFTAENLKEIYKLSNYADGMYIKFNHEGNLPNGTKLKLYVGDKFDNESVVNLYHYDITKKVLKSIKEGLIVKDGYIEFELESSLEHFVTMATISGVINEETVSKNTFLSFAVVSVIIIVGLVTFITIKYKPNRKINLVAETESASINFENNGLSQRKISNINNLLYIDNSDNIFKKV